MTHPTTQLADYVDGSLQGAERKHVESHLASCGVCASEVADAAKGRDALSSLPQVEVPTGVTSPVLREVRNTQGAQPVQSATQPKLQLRKGRLYGLAAASIAAVIALVFVLGGNRTQDVTSATGAVKAAPGTDMNKLDNEPGPLDLDGDYSASELSALAATQAQQRTGIPVPLPAEPLTGGATSAEASPSADFAGVPGGSLAVSKTAIRQSMRSTTPIASPKKLGLCLKNIDAYSNGGTLADSFEARYDGIPAYFAVLLEGPEPGQPADKVVIWVLNRDSCDIVAFTQQRYPSATPSPLPTTFFEP